MTSPESIVVSLELAKKLESAGWAQKKIDPRWPEDGPDWVDGDWYWIDATLWLACPTPQPITTDNLGDHFDDSEDADEADPYADDDLDASDENAA